MKNLYLDALSKIWKDVLFKLAGNLFPFYIGAFILFFIKRDEIGKVFDSQSFVLYASSFLFSTLYLWYKTLNNKKNELLSLLFFILMIILIALLYSFALINTPNDKNNSVNCYNGLDISIWSYVIFGMTFFLYIFYECKIFIKSDNTKSYKESDSQFKDLKDSFNNFDGDE